MSSCVCNRVSLTACEALLWPLIFPCPSPLMHPSCQRCLPQEMVSFPFPLSGFPCVRLPAQSPAPGASVWGSTLGMIHSGKPPICSLPGCGPRDVPVEEGDRAGQGGSWQQAPSGNRDRLLAPSQAPSLLSVLSSEQERRVQAPLCLCLGRDSPLQAPLGTGPLPAPHLALPALFSLLMSPPVRGAVLPAFLSLQWTLCFLLRQPRPLP